MVEVLAFGREGDECVGDEVFWEMEEEKKCKGLLRIERGKGDVSAEDYLVGLVNLLRLCCGSR